MLSDDDPRHGHYTTYSNGLCRECPRCRAAWAKYKREYYAAHPEQREVKNERARRYRVRVRNQMIEVPNAIIVEL